MKKYLITFICILCCVSSFSKNKESVTYTREHKLNTRVSIYSMDDGKSWGAKVDNRTVLEPEYMGIDMLGEKYLSLTKYDSENERLVYGTANLSGAIQLACEYEHISIQQGRLQAFKPPVIFDDDSFEPAPVEVTVIEEASNSSEDEYEDEYEDYEMSVIDYIIGETDRPSMNLSLIRSKIEENGEPKTTVEKMPSFPGGEAEMHRFIRDNLEFPEDAKFHGIQGKVVLRFVIAENGNAEDVEIMQSLEDSCDKEAIRIVKLMPRWKPGVQDGKKVPVYFTLPISFFF